MENSRAQLNDYFAAELAGLRTSAIEFAQENPSIAEELLLNRQNEGRSQDPHLEILIQSFAWLTSRLRQNIESESAKLPAMLLQQLYPQLVCSTPSMAIAECQVNGFAADFDNGYVLTGRHNMEPVSIDAKGRELDKLRQCKMASCFDAVLWPLKTKAVSQQAINDHADLVKHHPRAQSIVNIRLQESDKGAAESIGFRRPLRFFLNFSEQMRFAFYDFLSSHFVAAVVCDSNDNPLFELSKSDLKMCGFEDDERLFPDSCYQDLGFTLLQDYFSFPEKFMFFELGGLEQLSMTSDINIKMLFDENVPGSVSLNKESLKLNCVPVINLFDKITEPLPLHYKDYRYRLYPNREYYDCYEIVKVDKVFSVNKDGESKELSPYFGLDPMATDIDAEHVSKDRKSASYRWMVQQEPSHRKRLAGSETWLSLFDIQFNRSPPIGETIYANTLCSNRSVCELFPKSQHFAVVGSSPVTDVTLLTRPTRHRSSQMNKEHLWKLLSHISVYYVSLTEPGLAQDMLMRFLSLYANQNNPVSQRQIESIEKLEAFDDVQPHMTDGWRGYYRGTRFVLTLTERKFDGSSTILFAHVLHQFLALFCHINSFVRLELKLSNGRSYQCQPMSGHQMLI